MSPAQGAAEQGGISTIYLRTNFQQHKQFVGKHCYYPKLRKFRQIQGKNTTKLRVLRGMQTKQSGRLLLFFGEGKKLSLLLE